MPRLVKTRGMLCVRSGSFPAAHELRAFQDELSQRENSGEWIFLAYTEPGAAT